MRWGSGFLLVASVAAGCGVTFDAPDIALILTPDRIVYAAADGAERLVGGETIIEVRNSTRQERQVVLARVGEGTTEVPSDLDEAESARENSDILGFSRVLQPEESDFSAGGFGKKTDKASFHVYLAPGATYVLFDTLADARGDALVLWLHPGNQGRG